MRHLLIILLCLFSQYLQAQLVFDFELGNLDGWQQSHDNHWQASSTSPINGSYSLHHMYDDSVAGNDQISIPYAKIIDFTDTVEWSFLVRYGYTPSASNNWSVFLCSDKSAASMLPGAQASGIVAGVNFTGSDDILKLWKVENGIITTLISSTINWESSVKTSEMAMVSITRFPDGKYKFYFSKYNNKDSVKLVGSIDNSYIPPVSYFGVYYKYTKTCDQKLWIDDIVINARFASDTIAPEIDTAFIVTLTSVEIDFDKDVNPAKVGLSSFRSEGDAPVPSSFVIKNGNTILLNFETPMPLGKTCKYIVSGIEDMQGNVMNPDTFAVTYYNAQPYDVLVSEIMADPNPTVSLPDFEYLELYNRSEYPININNWQLTINNSLIILPFGIIPANGYIILCAEKAVTSFQKYGNTVGAWTTESPLLNSGCTLVLKDTLGRLISFLTYTDDWYTDNYKKSGGWSLEMIDPTNPCGGKENWKASTNKSGGTPGRQNSVWGKSEDSSIPTLLNLRVISDSSLIVYFSEQLDSVKSLNVSNFYVPELIENPKTTGYLPLNFSSIILIFSSKFEPGKKYELQIKQSVCDCVGNSLDSEITASFSLPAPPDSFDVVINELLFNPPSYCGGFVELYNRSSKVIDAGSIIFATIDTVTHEIKAFTNVAEPGTILNPENYLAVTQNIDNLSKYFNVKSKNAMTQQANFPSFDDKHGVVVLMKKDYSVIDKFEYSDNMHFSLLGNTEGVSLERLSANVPTQMPTNWHSAAQSAGFATPGYENSQIAANPITSGEVTVSPEIFTPDNNGIEDYVSIQLNNVSDYKLANIKIYTASGQCVCNLVSNAYLATSNSFTWNGVSDNHKLQQSGIYLIYIQLISDKGKTKEVKKVCVLANKR